MDKVWRVIDSLVMVMNKITDNWCGGTDRPETTLLVSGVTS